MFVKLAGIASLFLVGFLVPCGLALAQDPPQDKAASEAAAPVESSIDKLCLGHGTIGQITVEGFTYCLEVTKKTSDCDEDADCPASRLTIRDSESGKLIHDETAHLDVTPGQCFDFPAISSWPYKLPHDEQTHWLVVTCGGISWRHPIITVYMREPALKQLRTAKLDFVDDAPNLTPTKDGSSYIARTESNHYVDTYALQIGGTDALTQSIMFVPFFGAEVTEAHLKHFYECLEVFNSNTVKDSQKSKNQSFKDQLSSILLASLLSIEDQKLFCEKLKIFHKYGMTDKDIQSKIDGLIVWGYPKLYINKCKEGAK